jgi:hypothetical protein
MRPINNRVFRWLALALLLPAAAFAGKSLVLTSSISQLTSSVVDPLYPANQSWRVEFQIHNWTLPAPGNFAARIFELDGTGAIVFLLPNGLLSLGDFRDNVSPAQPCFVDISGHTNVLVRLQRNLEQGRVTCEAWNYDGTGYVSSSVNIVSTISTYSTTGGSLGGGALTSLGFLRVFTGAIPTGGQPPTTADGGNYTELKLDNNFSDSSGRGHNASVSGSPAFVNTPNQVANPFPKTFGAPSWSNWVSLRAGYPNKLDGSASFSLADASSSVNYFWQQVSGPSIVRWENRTSATPTITGLVFGTYTFSLRATDAGGSTAVANLQAGAVAYDDNGVVIPSDPRVTQIFGPMIAFGKNPWGYADERSKRAVELQSAFYSTAWPNPPVWATSGQGTVSYPFAGIGPAPGQTGTTLSSSITATSTSISIANATKLPGLASLPTWILIGNTIGVQEMVRITATTATSGPATLTVAYDGRGLSTSSSGNAGVVPAQAWSSGTTVGEMRIRGTGTLFASDPNRPICPAGLPGPIGPVIYSTGTVTLSPNSNVINGTGTSWTDTHGTLNPALFITDTTGASASTYFIRITATHGGGTPFVWWSLINSVSGTTQLVTSRSLPPDVDSGPFSYKITGVRYVSLEFLQPDGSTERALQNAMGCESETAAFSTAAHDIAPFDLTTQTGVHYSYKDTFGAQSAFGPNFYGSGLASRAFYLRSGWDFANTTANAMDDYWVRDPELCGGWCGASALVEGGGVIGAFANVLLNPATKLTWSDVRHYAVTGSIGGTGCNAFDTRDSGYLESWVTLAALFDPDTTQRNGWRTALQAINTRNNNCRNQGATNYPAETNSWSNGFVWAPNGSVLTPTTGSTAVTGTAIPASTCRGLAAGTAKLATQAGRLTALTGTFVSGGNSVIIAGTKAGSPFVAQFQISFLDGSNVAMAGLWPGDTGNVTWMEANIDLIANSDNIMTIASGGDDLQNLTKNWECIWNSGSSITLNRPWDGVNSGPLYSARFALAGYGQQPYMLGIKTMGMRWASALDSTLSTNFGLNASRASNWIHDFGYDPLTQGIFYGRVYQVCEPTTSVPANSAFDYRTPNCSRGRAVPSVVAARELTQEASPGLRGYYEANPTVPGRLFGDTAYGSLWCLSAFTDPTVYCDSFSAGNNAGQSNITDPYLSSSKWTGFFFGVGMAHQWPAVRVGGGLPARNRTVMVDFNKGTAASARIVLTAPSGVVTTFSCGSTAPCAVTVDDRQGTHWFKIQYLSSGGQVVAQSDPDLLSSAP